MSLAFDSADPPLPPNPRTHPDTLWTLLERRHHSVPEVRLIRLSWLLGPALAASAARSSWERFPPRHTLERICPEAFIGVDELRKLHAQHDSELRKLSSSARAPLPFVAVSHDWESLDHPDPRADRLVSIICALEQQQHASPALPTEIGVYLPWCSLPQEDPRGGRTAAERLAFVSALQTMPLWYTHVKSTVLLVHPHMQPAVDPDDDARRTPHARSAADGAIAARAASLGHMSQRVGAPPASGRWLAPHPMWAVGGGWPSVERSVLLMCGKRRSPLGGGWAQLIETRLGESDALGDARLSARFFASTHAATTAVHELRTGGLLRANDLLTGARTHLPLALSSAADTLIDAGTRRIEHIDAAVDAARRPLQPIRHNSSRRSTHPPPPSSEATGEKTISSGPLPVPPPPDDVDGIEDEDETFSHVRPCRATSPQPERYSYSATLAHRRDDRTMGWDVHVHYVRAFFDGIASIDLDHAAATHSSPSCIWGDADLEALGVVLPFLTRHPQAPSVHMFELNELPPPVGTTTADEKLNDDNSAAASAGAASSGRSGGKSGGRSGGRSGGKSGGAWWRKPKPPAASAKHQPATSDGVLSSGSRPALFYGGLTSRWAPSPLGYSVTRLQLARNQLGDGGVAVLAEVAMSTGVLSSLTHLSLVDNRIRDAGMAALGRALGCPHGLPRLVELTLSINRIGDGGMLALFDALKAARGSLPQLSTLRLDSNRLCDDGCRALARCFGRGAMAGVSELDLSNNRIADAGVASLGRVSLKALTRLRLLDLSGNALGGRNADGGALDHGVAAIAAALGAGGLCELRTLKLRLNRVGDDGATKLATAATQGGGRQLRELCLMDNRISKIGIDALAAVVGDAAALPQLATLGLGGNPGLEDARGALVAALGIGPDALLSIGGGEVIDARTKSVDQPVIPSWAAASVPIRRDGRL